MELNQIIEIKMLTPSDAESMEGRLTIESTLSIFTITRTFALHPAEYIF